MRYKHLAIAVVVATASTLSVATPANAWRIPDYMLIDGGGEGLWAPTPAPAPAPVVEPARPAPARVPIPYSYPYIPALREPVPVPAPVVRYEPPYVSPVPAASIRIPAYTPVDDSFELMSRRYIVPAPAVVVNPAPAPAPSLPSNTRTVAPDKVTTTVQTVESNGSVQTITTTTVTSYTVESGAPSKKVPLDTDGSNSISLKTVNFIENQRSYVQPTKAEDAMVASIRQAAASGMTLIRIEGYTDPQGSFTSGQYLSESRADAVKDSLEVMLEERGFVCSGGSKNTSPRTCRDTNGGPAVTLDPVGYSESYQITTPPSYCNLNSDNRPACEKAFAPNRRVEIKAAVPVVTKTVTTTDVATQIQRIATCAELGTCPTKPDPTCADLGTCPSDPIVDVIIPPVVQREKVDICSVVPSFCDPGLSPAGGDPAPTGTAPAPTGTAPAPTGTAPAPTAVTPTPTATTVPRPS